MSSLKKAMLIYPIRNNQILLGLKQKKVAAGKRSGYGGKQEGQDASMADTAIRELFEETGEGIRANKKDLLPQAIIDFTLINSEGNDFSMRVFIYLLEKFSGDFHDTEEMRDHQWFSYDAIPYDDMLVDNQLFLPKILNREYFTAEIISENGIVTKSNFVYRTQYEIDQLFDIN